MRFYKLTTNQSIRRVWSTSQVHLMYESRSQMLTPLRYTPKSEHPKSSCSFEQTTHTHNNIVLFVSLCCTTLIYYNQFHHPRLNWQIFENALTARTHSITSTQIREEESTRPSHVCRTVLIYIYMQSRARSEDIYPNSRTQSHIYVFI